MNDKKKKLTEEQVKALLNAQCHGKQWFLMRKSRDYNKLALFLKINGVEKIELGQKAFTYEVDLRDETIGGAFILTEKPWEDSTRWYVAAMVVAPDYRGHKIGDIMFQKIKKLVKENGGSSIAIDSAERIDRYRYAFRNEAFTYRQEGARGVCYYVAKCALNFCRIVVKAPDHRAKRVRVLIGSMVRGAFFCPKIEMFRDK